MKRNNELSITLAQKLSIPGSQQSHKDHVFEPLAVTPVGLYTGDVERVLQKEFEGPARVESQGSIVGFHFKIWGLRTTTKKNALGVLVEAYRNKRIADVGGQAIYTFFKGPENVHINWVRNQVEGSNTNIKLNVKVSGLYDFKSETFGDQLYFEGCLVRPKLSNNGNADEYVVVARFDSPIFKKMTSRGSSEQHGTEIKLGKLLRWQDPTTASKLAREFEAAKEGKLVMDMQLWEKTYHEVFLPNPGIEPYYVG